VAASEHVRSSSGVRQTHVCTQVSSIPQKLTAHAVASPSQSVSLWHGISDVGAVVLVMMVDDALVVVVVEDVVSGPASRKRVVVVSPGWWAGLVVVVTVAQGTLRGVARQRSTSFVGAAPASTAMRSRRVLPTGTVNVPAWHPDVPHTGSSNEQTPSHCPSMSQGMASRAEWSVRCATRPSRHDRRSVRADASSAVTAAATHVSMTST
jgi:hypothetical protein